VKTATNDCTTWDFRYKILSVIPQLLLHEFASNYIGLGCD